MDQHLHYQLILSELLKKYPPVLPLEEAAPLAGYRDWLAAYRAFRKGTFPVRLSRAGSRYSILLTDLALFLATGEAQGQLLKVQVRPAKKTGKKRGRPSVADLRAREVQAQQALAGGAK